MHILTKSKIISGLQCPKKLWFDVNKPIKQESYIFYLGNKFGEYARDLYGEGLNLEDELSSERALSATREALLQNQVEVIYEAAFIYDETLVRPDVLLRNNESWQMIEVKSSTSLKDVHINDAAIQTFVLRKNGLNLDSIKIGHINSDFVYPGDGNYTGLLTEVDITEEVNKRTLQVEAWIRDLKNPAEKGAKMPEVEMGKQCLSPYECNYIDRCEEILPAKVEVPISIIPRSGKKLALKFAEEEIYDLRDVPVEALTDSMHRVIQEVHKTGKTWIGEDFKRAVKEAEWPRYFMDFETVTQGVPLFEYTKPYQKLPFQWSVHEWSDQSQEISLQGGVGHLDHLDFLSKEMDRDFLTKLIYALGDKGPIYAHNASFELGCLKELSARASCADLRPTVELIMSRVVDTLELSRRGFYAAVMHGSFSIKSISKAIPHASVVYGGESEISGGDGAQLAWFKYMHPKTTEDEKANLTEKLKEYCAKDTYIMYEYIKYVMST